MRKLLLIIALVGLWFGVAGVISAQDSSAADPSYEGVTPGTDHTAPRADGLSKNPIMMTWPGFQMRPDGGSRFFVQTTGRAITSTRSSQGRFELLLKNARVHLQNNWRPLETQFFNTPVNRATVERRGKRDIAIVFDLREAAKPNVSQKKGKGGFHFVFIDFAKR